ncbi:YraN family protein [Candidatus Saccharibacteria bacterium]|nr:YraN family protein [Candidatus Saccharibacteria bacterium]
MSTTNSGHKAERAAAGYLEMRGFSVMELNWRRSRAEVDIIAQKDDTVFFVEVKYRATDHQGSGLDYITTNKLNKMRLGAELWVAETKWRGQYQLAAVEVAGRDYIVEHFIDNIL